MTIATPTLTIAQDFNVPRQRLSSYVAEKIVDLIRLDGLKDGDRLPSETQLAVRLRSSRAVLREALVALEARGQLLSRPGVGRIVTALSKATGFGKTGERHPGIAPARIPWPASIAQARSILEPKVAFVVASRPPHAELERLEESLAMMKTCGANELLFLQSDYSFHLALSVCTENRSIVDMVESMWQLWRNIAWQHLKNGAMKRAQLIQQTIDEHSAILVAVQRKQSISARKCMRQHIENEQLRFHSVIHGT